MAPTTQTPLKPGTSEWWASREVVWGGKLLWQACRRTPAYAAGIADAARQQADFMAGVTPHLAAVAVRGPRGLAVQVAPRGEPTIPSDVAIALSRIGYAYSERGRCYLTEAGQQALASAP